MEPEIAQRGQRAPSQIIHCLSVCCCQCLHGSRFIGMFSSAGIIMGRSTSTQKIKIITFMLAGLLKRYFTGALIFVYYKSTTKTGRPIVRFAVHPGKCVRCGFNYAICMLRSA